MKLLHSAQAGVQTKGDVLVTVEPADELTVKVLTKPIIAKQFGAQIEAAVRQAAAQEGVDGASIEVKDTDGALDFVIRARVRAALQRAKKGGLS